MSHPARAGLIHVVLILFAAAILARAAEVQLWQGDHWAMQAQHQHYAVTDIPAPRGTIFDANGVALAESREMIRVSIAPRELASRGATARELERLDVSRKWIARATDTKRAWVTLPGEFLPGAATALVAMRGVYVEPVLQRVYTLRDATRRIVGRVNARGVARDGLELVLDSILRGRPGTATRARDPRGASFALPGAVAVAPVPGDAVVLTINQALQEISERALRDAIASTGADGGDIVILDPGDGEIRALVSERSNPRSAGLPALTQPYEPGSVMKPFMAAALITRGLAGPADVVSTDGGAYTIEGRTIHDVEHDEAPMLSLRDVIRYSSNVGIVKFASRLSPQQEFESLRDFGFGTPTGLLYPAEAGGMLRPPTRWSRQSAASLAMGYEVSVTPLQLATAYAVFANGGELLAPALIKEIRASDGTVLDHHTARVVRREMSEAVARTMRDILRGVVEEGTGKQAELGRFAVAGKTGTARSVVPGKGYVRGHYTASFVGLFPADHPQYVILVKLENPSNGSFYASSTAAPIMKLVLEAAIASRDAALDRRELAASESLAAAVTPGGTPRLLADAANGAVPADTGRVLAERVASTAHRTATADDDSTRSVVLTLPPAAAPQKAATDERPVPDIRGLTLRQAVYALHHAGFYVQLAGLRPAGTTVPVAGSMLPRGAKVRLVTIP
jgi:cell division protein FtsI (penicillin-binding protein 3)